MRERGLVVGLRVEGEERPLAPGVDLTAYRVIEDALGAAAENEASEAALVVRYGTRRAGAGGERRPQRRGV